MIDFDPFLHPSQFKGYKPDDGDIRCNGCKRLPDQIHSYDYYAQAEGYTDNVTFVQKEEGTYNRENGHFWCDECYIKAGMPLGVAK